MAKTVGCELKKTHNLIRRYFESLRYASGNGKFADSYGRVLGFLYKNVGRDVFQKDIETEFSLRRSSASALLKKMETDGMITRVSVADDKRLKKIMLTAEALKDCRNIDETLIEFEKTLTDGLTDKELEAFFITLDKIQENLKKSAYKAVNKPNCQTNGGEKLD